MQAIVTTYKGPTNTRGSKIIAKCDAKKIFVPWSYDIGIDENHERAAMQLAKELGWDTYGRWFVGGLPNDGGRVFVCEGSNGMYEVKP